MAEFLSAGVYVEEVSNSPQTVEAVGTSTMSIVGFTLQGLENEATLITSPDGYTRKFGSYTDESLVALSINAFFANGGTRCYVVRVVPSDAVAATGSISDTITDEQVGGTQTGSTPVTVTDTLTKLPVTSGTVTIKWNPAVTATSYNPTMDPPEDTSTLAFTTTLANAPLTNDVLTLVWAESAVSKTATLTNTSTLGGANSANIASASINRTSGNLIINFAGGHAPDADSVRVTYKYIGPESTVADSSGTFTASGVSGTINYTSGAVSVTFTGSAVVPYNGGTVKADYTGPVWGLSAASMGEWGNDIRVTLAGSPNFLTYGDPTVTGAGTYSKFDITVSQLNSSSVYEIKETYEEVILDDASDAMYIVDVINNGSDLISVTDYDYLSAPAVFSGEEHLAESIGTGDGVDLTFSHTIGSGNRPVLKTSALIKYTIGATPRTATANSSGTISGFGLDTTLTNTINYTTGVITLNYSTAPDNSTAITVDYITVPTSSVNYSLSSGDDGTIANITNLTVSNSSALKADKKGMYALDRIDEMMSLIIPDFAGDTTVQGDMMDYADTRRDVFCILTTPSGLDADEAVDYIRITLAKKSKYSAAYWPWVKVADPLSSTRQLVVPPVAHIAGVFSRTDNTKNVSKAPAGTVDGALRGIVGLESNPGKGERDTVYPARLNPLINTPQTGMAVWGCRTLSATNDAFKFIGAVRLFMFVEKSVFNSTQSYVFESIGPNLYTAIKGQLESFLRSLFLQGYLAGAAPSQAYSVVCDSTNNPPEISNQGQVICDVGIAPNKPGEIIRFRLAQRSIS